MQRRSVGALQARTGWAGGGASRDGEGTPSAVYGVNADDLRTRTGAALDPTPLTNGASGGRYPDRFAATPAADDTVYWQPENTVAIVEPGAGDYLFWNDRGGAAYTGYIEGPKTGAVGAPTFVLPDADCTVAWAMQASTVIGGGSGYVPVASILTSDGSWGRDFSYNYPNIITTGVIYVTSKDGTVTVHGNAAEPAANMLNAFIICVFRQTAGVAQFSVLNHTTGAVYSGGYSEARTPTGGKLKVRIGNPGSGDAVAYWRSLGALCWPTWKHISNSAIHTAVDTYLHT